MRVEEFKDFVKAKAEEFKQWDKKATIRVISHLDSDGICACSLLTHALNRDNRKYSITIVPQLKEDVVREIADEDYKYYVFTDLGSGNLSDISKYFTDKIVLILDHHQIQGEPTENITHINPLNFDIDGSKEISGSGVVFLFVQALNPENKDFVHLAIIGAIGDVQENKGFGKLNDELLQLAIEEGRIKRRQGLRFFGLQTRPIHKLLEYSNDLIIPEVTGSESSSIQFLKNLGIEPQDDKGNWKRLDDLTDDEKKKLIAGIVMKRSDSEDPEDIFTNVYELPGEENGLPFRDAREFSTLLNACGRMNNASLGIGVCLGDKKMKEKAIASLKDYKKEIVNAMKWYKANKDSEFITKGKGYMIINAEDKVLPTMIGTISSILSNSNSIDAGTFILGLAQNVDGTTKVSFRYAGQNHDNDLKEIISSIVKEAGGEAGGHKDAAGAIIETANEKKFLEVAKRVLEERGREEKVNQ
ncbi:MAG: DHH family phosphoesterase [archaeon]